MHRIIVTIIVFLAFTSLLAQSLEITDFQRVDNDMTARVTAPRMDNYGKPMALLKISTALTGVSVTGTGYCEVEAKTGELWVYVGDGTFNIKVAVEGYERLVYPLPETAKSAIVYRMKLRGNTYNPHIEVLNLTFEFNTDNVAISLDDKAFITAFSTVSSFSLPAGSYSFTFRKDGYKTQTREITLTDDQSISIKMETGQDNEKPFAPPGIIIVDSDPTGAEVEFNGQKVGTTPYQGSHNPGEYTLTLRKDMYYSSSKSFALSSGETLTVPTSELKPRFGHWTVTSNPTDATIYLDEKDIGTTPLQRQDIRSGDHSIRLEKAQYKTHMENFAISDGDEKRFDITLDPNFARLEIDSAPQSGATLLIDNKEVGTTPWVNERMGAGTYSVRVEKPLWAVLPRR